MTNAEADKRARAAMQSAYKRHPDPGDCASWEILTLCLDAVRAEFGQMDKKEFERVHSLNSE